jgi:broad specificity phosphatase PhoE
MTKFLLIRHGETEWNRELIFRGRSDIPLSAVGRRQAAQLAAALADEPLAAIYVSPLSRAQDTAAAIALARKSDSPALRDEWGRASVKPAGDKSLAGRLRSVATGGVHETPPPLVDDQNFYGGPGQEIEVLTSNELIDMNCGAWEGLSVAEVQARYPQEYEMWTNHPDKLVLPGGEGLAAVRTRLRRGLRQWHKLHENQTIALVTHRIVCKILLCEILRLPNSAFWQIQQDLCALNVFANSGLPLVNPDSASSTGRLTRGCPRGLRTHAKFGKYVLLKMNDTCHLRGIAGKPSVDF